MEWYGYCQICGARTPSDEETGETRETVKSIVSLRGGRYKGEFREYRPANSLLLCPRHHVLYERALVKLQDVEEALEVEDGPGKLRGLAEGWSDDGLRIGVFEGENKEREARWHTRTLDLRKEHAKGMLSNLADWVESHDRN